MVEIEATNNFSIQKSEKRQKGNFFRRFALKIDLAESEAKKSDL